MGGEDLGAGRPVIPTRDELGMLSARLMSEYEPRFKGANMDLSIGRIVFWTSRGIGLEINGDYHAFEAARWRLFRRGWVVAKGLPEVETDVRDFLEAKLLAGPSP